MLKKKKQYQYINKRCDNMIACVNNFSTHQHQEELHKLRVETKKLRGYTSFVSKLTKEDFKKDIQPVVEVFRKAGDIRSAQLTIKIMQRHKIQAPHVEHGHQAESAPISQQFIRSSEAHIQAIEKVRGALVGHCTDIRNKKISKFYKKEINALCHFFCKNFDEKKLHSRRKIMKRLLYVENLLPGKLKRRLALNTFYLDALQDISGEWHDIVLVSDLLKSKGTIDEHGIKLMKEQEALLHAVKALAEHFEKNISLKKTRYEYVI